METGGQTDGGIRTGAIAFTPATLRMIAEIDEFEGVWTAIGRISPVRIDALRRIANIESIGSSIRIEGAKLSDRIRRSRSIFFSGRSFC
jgi:hypothetical protein